MKEGIDKVKTAESEKQVTPEKTVLPDELTAQEKITLDIIYQDKYLVAINKPHGLLVHPTGKEAEERDTAMYLLKEQLEKWIYVTHRLDSKTAGAILFAINAKVQKKINSQFENRLTKKVYYAIVRGYTEDAGTIDYALINTKGKTQDAITHYETLSRSEIDIPLGKHETSRYSLVKLMPDTGRYHQIRKHLAHIDHPIIGDRPHGCNKQNRFFKEVFNSMTMFLHAHSLRFYHPRKEEDIEIVAPLQADFQAMLTKLSLSLEDETEKLSDV